MLFPSLKLVTVHVGVYASKIGSAAVPQSQRVGRSFRGVVLKGTKNKSAFKKICEGNVILVEDLADGKMNFAYRNGTMPQLPREFFRLDGILTEYKLYSSYLKRRALNKPEGSNVNNILAQMYNVRPKIFWLQRNLYQVQ